ncbi:MAG: replication-associated recombination protein A [Bacteroidia bacterium]|nr:replication-associated recombination protein A [Bacteroidia bacterium]
MAEKMRPNDWDEVVGQERVVESLRRHPLRSTILWGPPGTGKTTLAQIAARRSGRVFQRLSAVEAGVREIRAVIEAVGVVLFIDEIHRLNKSQQDVLLHAVETGRTILIGATTQNPSLELNSALLSRCKVYVLEPLGRDALEKLVERARSFVGPFTLCPDGLNALYTLAAGDARKALNILEWSLDVSRRIDAETVRAVAEKNIRYDDDMHYDCASAFIKSVRGSDPNGAIYWLARMLEGGEDLRFIARRMIILASEDVGNANPTALALAVACAQACEYVGMPEARIVLAQTAAYLAASPKSNAAYRAIEQALEAVRNGDDPPVPLHLCNAPTPMMKELGYSAGYKYSHDYSGTEGNQEFLPRGLENTTFYRPKPVGREKDLLEYLKRRWPDKYGYG